MLSVIQKSATYAAAVACGYFLCLWLEVGDGGKMQAFVADRTAVPKRLSSVAVDYAPEVPSAIPEKEPQTKKKP